MSLPVIVPLDVMLAIVNVPDIERSVILALVVFIVVEFNVMTLPTVAPIVVTSIPKSESWFMVKFADE